MAQNIYFYPRHKRGHDVRRVIALVPLRPEAFPAFREKQIYDLSKLKLLPNNDLIKYKISTK